MLRRAAVVLPLVVLLSGCIGEPTATDVTASAAPLPSSVAALSLTSGQYLVTLSPGVDGAAEATKVAALPGVQSAVVTDGVLDVQFTGGSTEAQHREVLRVLAALGEVGEGV